VKRSPTLLLLILLTAAALRLYRVSEMPLRADEASSLFLALRDPQAIVREFIANDPHMPLYFLVEHYWTGLAGISELAARFPAVFVGVLCVALTYTLGRQLFPRRQSIALLGAAFIALNPFLIWDAQDIYMYSSLTATTLVSFNLFLRVFRSGSRWWHWLAYIITSATGLYFHYFFVFIMLAQGTLWLYWIFARQIDRRATSRFVLAQSAVVLLFLPWLIVAFPLLTTFRSDFIPASSLLEMCQRALVTFTVGRTDTRMAPAWVDPTIGTVLSLGFLTIFLYGVLGQNASERAGRIALAIFLGVPLGGFFVYSLVRFPLFDERYVLYISFAFALLLARGIANFWESKSRRWIGIAACAFILLADGYALNNYFHVPEFARSPDWRAFMQTLIAQAQPGDVLIQNYPDPALPYYLQDRMPRVLLPRSGSTTAAEVSADLNRLTAKYDRLWVQPVPFAEWDTNGLVVTWLDRHAYLAALYEFHGLKLALYLPPRTALRQATPSHAIFDGSIRLLGYHVERPEKIQPATIMHGALYWQAQSPPTRALTVFLHLYSTDGKLWSQHDAPPRRGTYPTTQWSPGEIIVDQFDMEIPADMPVGTYSLFVGMYDSLTQERVTIVDDKSPVLDRRLFLMNIMVDRTIR